MLFAPTDGVLKVDLRKACERLFNWSVRYFDNIAILNKTGLT